MSRPDARLLRFVRALLRSSGAERQGQDYRIDAGLAAITIKAEAVAALLSAGAITATATGCYANAETRSWLRRQLLEDDAFAAQHRLPGKGADGTTINLAESPLARLAIAATGETRPFLERHQVEAGEKVRKLAERARLQPRLTMTYSASRFAGGQSGGAAEIGDMAADARRALAEIHKVLPRDCAGVVLDVCGLLKGFQTVEAERGWPRRSAKLVLRIGLDRLAEYYGFAPFAVGPANRKQQNWLGDDARPTRLE